MPHVLVVCDDMPVARLLTQGLREASFSAARAGYPDLDPTTAGACSAVVLVGPPALDLCRRVRQERADVPVVVVGLGSRFPAGAASDAGADGVMFEPIRVTDLVARLRDLLEHGSAIRRPA